MSRRGGRAPTLDEIAERDGWVCWICGQGVDPTAPKGSAAAASLDHVIPRSKGGSNETTNLRLAHRRCNMRRSNHLPELEWPNSYHLSLPVPLWEALGSRATRPGEWQVVALTPPAEAPGAAGWLTEAVELVGEFEVRHTNRGALAALEVRATGSRHQAGRGGNGRDTRRRRRRT